MGLTGPEARANTLEVLATVPDACTVHGGSLDFGEYTPGQMADTSASGSFDIECVIGANVDIKLDAGANHNGTGKGDRAMTNGTDFLSYVLLHPDGSQEWGDGDGGTYPGRLPLNLPLAADGNTITVNGIIRQGQTPLAGDYSDTVTISLEFN